MFLGDYIYENIDHNPNNVRKHSDGVEASTLSTYRNRYAQYRLDPDLQRLHAEVPALITWDDHEVQNDYADQWSETFDNPNEFLRRRAAAYQAFYEHMPLRPSLSRPDGPNMRVYDRLTFGNLVKISMIDGRQYRSREACYEWPNRGGGHLVTDANCIERLEESRSMIGAAQERWLYQGLASSKTRWNIITQDVLIAQLRQESADGGARFWSDNWNGYPASLDFERSQMSVIRIHPFPLYGPLYLKTKSPAHGPRRFDRNCSNVLLARSGATVPQRKWQATC